MSVSVMVVVVLSEEVGAGGAEREAGQSPESHPS